MPFTTSRRGQLNKQKTSKRLPIGKMGGLNSTSRRSKELQTSLRNKQIRPTSAELSSISDWFGELLWPWKCFSGWPPEGQQWPRMLHGSGSKDPEDPRAGSPNTATASRHQRLAWISCGDRTWTPSPTECTQNQDAYISSVLRDIKFRFFASDFFASLLMKNCKPRRQSVIQPSRPVSLSRFEKPTKL